MRCVREGSGLTDPEIGENGERGKIMKKGWEFPRRGGFLSVLSRDEPRLFSFSF